MVRPWDISADDLNSWADQGVAFEILPRLVRRLLLASVDIHSLHMAADGGVRMPGWDGVVRSAGGHPFCPSGWSGWELSVEKRVSAKLGRDFRARTQDASPLRPAETTYVAVTARRFAGDKAKWEASHREQGTWKDVRLLDADDLATWLEQSTAVALWFAALLGRPVNGFRDLDGFLSHWSGQTTPRFPPEIITAGREAQVKQVHQWLIQPKPPRAILTVHSEDTRDEAFVFVAAALQGLPESERDRLLARSLVVETQEAFQWATQQGRTLLLFPSYKEFTSDHAFTDGHVIAPVDGALLGGLKPDVDLAWLPRHPTEQLLCQAGLSPAEAERKVAQAEGKLSALRRLCGYFVPPPWSNWVEEEALYALLLAGACVPAYPGDAEAVGRLGADAARVEQICMRLQQHSSPPVRRETNFHRQSILKLVSPLTVWPELAGGIAEARLRRFADVTQDVFGSLDPGYELPNEQRSAALFLGKSPRYSEELRHGLARSLVMLILHEDKLPTGLQTRGLVAGLLRRVLPTDWRHWASLSPILPTMSEADPETFLHLLEASLNYGTEGVTHLFALEVPMGHSPHTGLLFAIEGLAWNPEFMPRAVYALARLASADPGGTIANRPLASMKAILRGPLPQTLATVEDRLAVLEKIFRTEPNIAWSLSLRLLPKVGILINSHRPQWLPWPLPSQDESSTPVADYCNHLDGTIALLIEYAADDAQRWTELLGGIYHLPPEVAEQVLLAMEKRHRQICDPDGLIPSKLRKRLWLLHGSERTEESPLSRMIERTEQIYQLFLPENFVLREAWPLQSDENLPRRFADFNEEDQYREKLQIEALEKLWQQPNKWELLEELVARVGQRSYQFPRLLAHSAGAEQLEQRLHDGFSFNPYSQVAPLFLAWRLASRELSAQTSWLHDLLHQGRHEEAAQVAHHLSPNPALWDYIDAMGEPLRLAYWRGAPAPGGTDSQQRGRAIRNLLDAGALAQALTAAAWRQVPAPAAQLLDVLEQLRSAQIATQNGASLASLLDRNADYQIVQVFELLDDAEGLDPNQILKLEIFFSPVLQHSGRRPKLLTNLLSERPEFFVQLLELMYRPEGQPKRAPAPTPQEEERATAAHEILDNWTAIPGTGLPPMAREDRLYQWTRAVLEHAQEARRKKGATIEVARVLARAPWGTDDIWPCMAARKLLEGRQEGLFECLFSEALNRRGMVRKEIGEGGAQERSLAATYRESARRLRIEYPETAKLLSRLAESYERDAQHEDFRGRSDRRRYGLPSEGT